LPVDLHLLFQMRRLKESLVANALKLQVAAKLVQCDETTIQYLRRDLEEAKKSLCISSQKETAANDLVQALRLEIIQLKRRLKEDHDHHQHTHVATGSIAMVHHEADNQVKRMMNSRGILFNVQEGNETALLVTEKDKPTHFQEWKMKKFLWSPDAPGGSLDRDDQVVEELLRASMAPFESGVMKTNKITVAKRRPGTTTKLTTASQRPTLLPGLSVPPQDRLAESSRYLSQSPIQPSGRFSAHSQSMR
jgi:hypothetical protein